ncbi:bacteriophage N4 adsorption protein B [Bryobacterales bacterium F-183]|nr:bacteriophage N4 adsorption protein B [Bryobacterales bacterium F-183]
MGGYADSIVLAVAAPIAIYILISGLDELIIDVCWLALWWTRKPPKPVPVGEPERRIAIIVPAWKEDAVIQQMIEHNAATLHYERYDFFVGIYPNDPKTLAAVEAASRRVSNVYWAMVPHDGPTSKGDCLNWIYQNILLHEQTYGIQYDALLMHDAEDIIHPEALRYVSHYLGTYGFVQVPVLALQTPIANVTHGIYCDEFAETQTRDLPVRQWLNAFVPSAGVGTGISRDALELLARNYQNRVFEPDSLTEDYDMGLRLHECGCRQMFLPLQRYDAGFVATREYFPTEPRTAIRQRTRWVTGIALQTWQRYGWKGNWMRKYWFWRDRKGLVGGPVGILANLVFLYVLAAGLWQHDHSLAMQLAPYNLMLLGIRIASRMYCTARVYGLPMAYLVPVRILAGSWINGMAAVRAVYRFTKAHSRGERLSWLKTEHKYPSRETLVDQRRRLGDLLVRNQAITRDELELVAINKPAGLKIGEYLVRLGRITEDELYEALCFQQQMPLAEVTEVPLRVARSLPAWVMQECNVVPFRVEAHALAVCSPNPPDAATRQRLEQCTKLEVRYYLITPSRFEKLLLAAAGVGA